MLWYTVSDKESLIGTEENFPPLAIFIPNYSILIIITVTF